MTRQVQGRLEAVRCSARLPAATIDAIASKKSLPNGNFVLDPHELIGYDLHIVVEWQQWLAPAMNVKGVEACL